MARAFLEALCALLIGGIALLGIIGFLWATADADPMPWANLSELRGEAVHVHGLSCADEGAGGWVAHLRNGYVLARVKERWALTRLGADGRPEHLWHGTVGPDGVMVVAGEVTEAIGRPCSYVWKGKGGGDDG